ncbi:hypothetical protein RND71_032605 [Anisodus tanguticus]|uniref:Rad21/Rec8-like protein N-terminal domain-containing protein n=1 Tax=Anisodus tanguticus TaxID=243964 RepID=A0AAE1R7L5_9SOLA|nr:hypothetical protein RND71_032605 [Anisodus tanguticus]
MFPTVPLALRQYGTLLLGVVRIRSKQVEYFFQDCRNLETGIRKAFLFTNVNLPEDATHAPYYSITLPETFELIDFDEDPDLNRKSFEDTHIKSHEVITLEDQMLTCEDQYVAIFIDEDTWRSSSKSGEVSGLGVMPMETDTDPSNPDRTSAQSQNPSPKNQAALDRGTVHDDIPQNIPEIEIMCDAVHDHGYESVSLWQDHGNDVMEPDKILEEQIMNDKETASLVAEEMVAPGGQQEEPPSAISAEEDHAESSGNHFPQPVNDLGIEIERLPTVGTQSDHMGRTMESGALPTLAAASTGHVGSDMETPSTWYGEGLGLENTVLSDIPEFDNSAADLNFLDQDDDTLIGYLSIKQGGTPEFDTIQSIG